MASGNLAALVLLLACPWKSSATDATPAKKPKTEWFLAVGVDEFYPVVLSRMPKQQNKACWYAKMEADTWYRARMVVGSNATTSPRQKVAEENIYEICASLDSDPLETTHEPTSFYLKGQSKDSTWHKALPLPDEQPDMMCVSTAFRPMAEFKITVSEQSWEVSFPSSNYVVDPGGIRTVCFNYTGATVVVSDPKPASQQFYLYHHLDKTHPGILEGPVSPWFDGYCTKGSITGLGQYFTIANEQRSLAFRYPEDMSEYAERGPYLMCLKENDQRGWVTSELQDEWYIRDPPSGWGTGVPLLPDGDTHVLFCKVRLYGKDAEYKISRYADNWNEAYPPSNRIIVEGPGRYKVCFNPRTLEDNYTILPSSTWVFKSGANDEETMYLQDELHCTRQFINFTNATSGEPRPFSFALYTSWKESDAVKHTIPAGAVTGEYEICISPYTHEVSVTVYEEWYLHPVNAEESIRMQVAEPLGDRTVCTSHEFTAEGLAFRICKTAFSENQCYPEDGSYVLQDGAGRYHVCFNPVSAEIKVSKPSSPTNGGVFSSIYLSLIIVGAAVLLFIVSGTVACLTRSRRSSDLMEMDETEMENKYKPDKR